MKYSKTNLIKIAVLNSFVFFSSVNADISGTVFKDFNANGVLDVGEIGVADIEINAFDENGSLVATTKSINDGSYTLTISNDGKYRIEFSENLPDGLKPGGAQGASTSSVQFVNSKDATNINYSVIKASLYSPGKDSVAFAVPTYHPGASVEKTDINKRYGIISLPYTATGDKTGNNDLNNPDFSKDATFSKMGTVWGTGYQRRSGLLYAAAFLKRHQGLGELVRPEIDSGEKNVTVDGIYIMEYNATIGGAYKGGFKLNGITPANGNGGIINLGTVTREVISAKVDSSHPNALTTSTSDNRSFDIDAFNKTGRIGFGDLDIDETDKNLWVINLNQKSLIKVDISNPDTLATNDFIDSSLVSHYQIDLTNLPTCNGEYHPWALGFNNNKGYVGVICDATVSKNADDLRAYILEFDTNNPTSYTLVKDFALNYEKEIPQYNTSKGECSLGSMGKWNYWATNWDELGAALGYNATGANDSTYGAERTCAQPVLSDISFDVNGDMVLAFMDRFSLQLDRVNYAAKTSIGTNRYYSADSGGDLLHLCKNETGYLIEGEDGCIIDNDTKDSPADNYGVNRYLLNDGPNGVGEFYFQDYSTRYDYGEKAHHVENMLGSAVVLPGASEVLTTTYDTIIGTFNQGFLWFNTNTASSGTKGGRANQYQISKEGDDQLNTKGMGLGDVELLLPPAPIEIGNRVWLDSNRNGVQDANEEPIANVKVELYKGACGSGEKLGEVNTTSNGEYYFGGPNNNGLLNDYALEPQTDYQICISLTDPQVADKNVTTVDSDEDNIDSDGDNGQENSGYSTIVYTTGDVGENDHTLDFGFTPTYCLGDYVWEDVNANGIQDNNEIGIEDITAELYKDGNPTGITTNTDVSGKYKFCLLEPGNYSVKFSNIPKGYVVTTQNESSTDDNNDSDVNKDTLISDSIEITNSDNMSVDLGLIKLVCLGDFVWYDKNKDGIQDSTEEPIEGVTVELWQDGAKLKDTETNSSGYYEFCELEPNSDFTVKFVTPNGYAPTKSNEGSDDSKDSDPVDGKVDVSVASDNNMTIDAGFIKVCLGDYVWEDKDVDGVQDSDEEPIEGVAVTLKDEDGNVLESNTTDSDGKYEFCDLDVNKNYIVEFTTPAGYTQTIPNAGDDSNDSDVEDGKVEVSLGEEDDMSIDAGYYKPVCLGDYVWEDTNANGIQDDNESGIDNVKVTLYLDDQEINTTTTQNGGEYKFCDLVPNRDYKVEFSKPSGYYTSPANEGGDESKDSNIDPTTDTADAPIENEDDLTIDAGFFKPATISNFIWEDKNADGIQDDGEPGIEGVTVELLDSNGDSVKDADGNDIKPVTTDANGIYEFKNLVPGEYHIYKSNTT